MQYATVDSVHMHRQLSKRDWQIQIYKVLVHCLDFLKIVYAAWGNIQDLYVMLYPLMQPGFHWTNKLLLSPRGPFHALLEV